MARDLKRWLWLVPVLGWTGYLAGGEPAGGLRDEPGRLVLRTGQSTMVIDKEAYGAIVSLIDNAKQGELIARDPAAVLFRLGFFFPAIRRAN